MQTSQLNPLKVGLCAFGMSGKVFHAPFLTALLQFELSAVVERHTVKAAEDYPTITSYKSVDELMADKHIDLVVVNTPNATHFDYAKQGLVAGKHVIIEKPFCLTTAETEELIALAKENGLFLCAFQNRRWDSDFQAVQQVKNDDVLGRIVEAEFHYDRFRPGFSSKKHKETPGAGAGILFDLGPHLIDQALVLFGVPDAIYAHIAQQRQGAQVDDYFALQLYYPGMLCTLKAGQLVKALLPAYVLHGEKGSFIKSRSDVQEAELSAGKQPTAELWGQEPLEESGVLFLEEESETKEMLVDSPRGDYGAFYTAVYKAIVEGVETPVALSDTLWNVKLIEAAYESHQQQGVIKLKA